MPLPVSRGLLHPQFGGQGYLRGRVVLGSSVRNRSGGIEEEMGWVIGHYVCLQADSQI